MANKQRGIAELEMGGKTYNLQLTLDALAEVEDHLGLESLVDIQTALNPPKAKNIKVILAALIMGGSDIQMKDAMKVAGKLTVNNLMALPETLGAVIEMAMDDGEENPPAEAATVKKQKNLSR